jgi:hypothetical protein
VDIFAPLRKSHNKVLNFLSSFSGEDQYLDNKPYASEDRLILEIAQLRKKVSFYESRIKECNLIMQEEV